MSYYTKAEQETLYLYDPAAEQWRVHSTYPPHIRKLLEALTETDAKETDEHGRVILVSGALEPAQIRLYR
ncbi:hypothetical protein [Salimicrobium flavidum]|uniref:Uncharacterized protein n=1 Tax=Salimicrobium flavidum TaxID=570947 RepID=A0A1N7JXH3_9BACI|nr:hypothetical protein [Salimicrobium flavidum]SIS54033.1 hypothetical protein SAMN05421687_10826 [Salimicrobium flavidum]